MNKILIRIIFSIFLVMSLNEKIYSADVKDPQSLPLIIVHPRDASVRLRNNLVEDYEYLRKYYGFNETSLVSCLFSSEEEIRRWAPVMLEFKKRGFFVGNYENTVTQSALLKFFHGDSSDKIVPYAVDEKGEYFKNEDIRKTYRDKIDPKYLSNYVYPMIDLMADKINANDIFSIIEWNLDTPTYSKADIEAFRKNLLGEDDGIEWIFYDKHIEHLNFWDYAKVQLGMEKEDYHPDMLGEFSSYNEYVPAPIRGGGTIGDFINYSDTYAPKIYGEGEKYYKNVDLLRCFQDYEQFKLSQKIYKYAKEKGAKYTVWCPNWRIAKDISQDPYVDYVGMRGGNGSRCALIPGGRTLYYLGNALSGKRDHVYLKMGVRYYQLLNELCGKANAISTETVTPYRMGISFYRDAFSNVLVDYTLAKPKYMYIEHPVADTVFTPGLADSLRQYSFAVLDGYRQLVETGLNKGRILRSNWLIQMTKHEYDVFGPHFIDKFPNFSDMRSELYLKDGYIPDMESSQGTNRIPLENYKVITMGGEYFTSMTIDFFKEWLNKGEGRTLFTNYFYLGRYLFGYPSGIKGERYTQLGIYKTPEIIEHRVKNISWIDKEILPDVKPGDYILKCALPKDNIFGNLPSDAKIVMKGITEENIEVPLVFIIPKGKNRIIHITFALDEFSLDKKGNGNNLELGYKTMSNLFTYIQMEDNFLITRVKSSLPIYNLYRGAVLDNKGVVTICAQGDSFYNPSYVKIDPAVLEYENHKVVSKIDDDSLIIASLDGSALAGISSIKIDNILYVKEVKPETIYVIATLDNKSYNDSNLLHLWTQESTKIIFLKPNEWKDEKKIKIYNFEGTEPVEMQFKIKNEYIEFQSKGGEYKIWYDRIEESLWEKFCERLKAKEQILTRFDDSNWEKRIPGTPLSLHPTYTFPGSSAWYRVHFKIPESWRSNSLVLDLGKHYSWNVATVFLNGESIGTEGPEEEGQVFPRRYIISKDIIKYGEDNVIAVYIFNLTDKYGLGGDKFRLINPTKVEIIDLSKLDWVYKEGMGDFSYGRY